ncbi:hypothetical protein SRHO_G00074520 [Serrasalmus rhombeus]
MLLTFYLLFCGLHVSEACSLEKKEDGSFIKAHAGGSVLLPCYCTDLHTKPETFTWKKLNTVTNTWEEISSESGQYRHRVQLINGHSPGNLSLLISHLTEEDGGFYRCNVGVDQHADISLTVKACSLEKKEDGSSIKAHAGGSVLLPCYCTDLHTKPETFTWKKLNTVTNTWEEISSWSGQYRHRVQLVNGHSPGNLSLLISHLTEEDGGFYRCNVGVDQHADISLTVKVLDPPKTTTPTTVQTTSSTSTASYPQVSDYCTLEKNGHESYIRARAGGSVLLPCYCTDLHTKPETFSWKKENRHTKRREEISSESGQYRDRVQLVNGHSPGNLSLLISLLTEEDGGEYICAVKGSHIIIKLTLQGCTLVNHERALGITAHTGGSVLLPCYCTDLHTTPERFSWRKYNRNAFTWEVISSESGQYRDRVQLVNGHSPGNLSLLISHLTEKDGEVYRCDIKGSGYTDIILTVKGCTLVNHERALGITAHTGGSVLLPCYCTDLHTTPEEFSWRKENRHTKRREEISSESGQYRDRVQLVNGHSPGNLSLLISHLTEEDGGDYICAVKGSHIIIKLTLQVLDPPKTTTPTTVQTTSSTSTASSPQPSDVCTLVKNENGSSIKAPAGGSVLLPCFCTDLHRKPETFTWKKLNTVTNMWEVISSGSGQYRDRVQLVTGHSPGNLSLLISHLTEEDRGVYRCDIRAGEHIDIRLTVEGCTLVNHERALGITAHTGGSVLLPCYCTDLHTTPEEFSWRKENRHTKRREEISSESGQYRDRVQLVNGHSPGNLSLLISHLTEEDGGDYICAVKGSHIIIKLTLQVLDPPKTTTPTTVQTTSSTSTASSPQPSDVCTLVKNENGSSIKAPAGGSVLLPCFCTDLHRKPETFTWKKLNTVTNMWEVISSGSGQYRDRTQLVNGHSPGNLSLLISHLTEEDRGVYRCDIRAGEHIDIRLTVEGCTLVNHERALGITAHTGGSVLLPCYCTDLHTTPEEFSWRKENRHTKRREEISSESGQYRDRVQLGNGHSPGNLSLLISHLTEEDGGDYICAVKGSHIIIKLTLQVLDPPKTTTPTTVQTTSSTSTASSPQPSDVCTLVKNENGSSIKAPAGGSVLLPCFCTDLHRKPETFTWKKLNTVTNMWEVISSGSGQYRDRTQLVNGHSPGNLSLLISHLTEEDRGVYRCDIRAGEHIDIRLTVEGCTLVNHERALGITAHTGGSVLLPCYCTDLHTKPEKFSWKKENRHTKRREKISSESGQYRDRVQLVNGHSPGNLSLVISHLTEEDGGDYICAVKGSHIIIKLTLQVLDPPKTTTPTTVQTTSSTSTASYPQPSDVCTLVKKENGPSIKAHAGGSVLLPCYCTDLHTTPERFSWKKENRHTKRREEISSESGQYRDRVHLVNGHSPGNLSLVISHLTEEDGGDYICAVKGSHIIIKLTLQVLDPPKTTTPTTVQTTSSTSTASSPQPSDDCTLVKKENGSSIKAPAGGSVLLPCFCIDLHSKPERFSWKKLNTVTNMWEVISSESGQYRDRVQLVTGHSPGNLSLLISHLTEEDGGDYRCDVGGGEHIDIRLTVEGYSTFNTSHVLLSILIPLVLILLIGGVIYWRCKGQGGREQRSMKRKQTEKRQDEVTYPDLSY